LKDLSKQIAYVTINPRGPFLKSLQAGFDEAGISPGHLIVISPRKRLLAEWRKHRLAILRRVLLPKLKAIWHASKKQSNAPTSSSHSLRVHKVKNLNSEETVELLQRLQIRYLINAGAGIFGRRILSIPSMIVINAHAGLLPKYRNMNVVEWAIYNGDPVVGTVHRIEREIDTGPILMQKPLNLAGAGSLFEAREMAFAQVAKLVAPAVLAHALNKVKEVQQRNDEGINWYVMHSFFTNQVESKLSGTTHV
jgi:methionyl-tRNA formyltransferase